MSHGAQSNHSVTCLNCNNHFHGNFCNNCGQDAHTGKIDRHFLNHELQHALFHVDKGIFYTLITLFTRPGQTIRSFIEGKRVKHFKPLMFLLIMAGLYAFVNHFFGSGILPSRQTGVQVADNSIKQVNEYINEHYEWFVLVQLPLIAWIYYLFFKKYSTNYAEQLVVCAYVSGMHTLINIVLLPLLHYHQGICVGIEILVQVALYLWTYLQYYSGRPKGKTALYAILGYACFYVILIILLSLWVSLLANL